MYKIQLVASNVPISKTNLFSIQNFPINSNEDYHKFQKRNKIKLFEKLSYFDVFTFWWLIIISDVKLWVSPVVFFICEGEKTLFFFTFSSSQLRPEAKFHFLRFNKLLILMTRQGFKTTKLLKDFDDCIEWRQLPCIPQFIIFI
jgi:hypothetical protein